MHAPWLIHWKFMTCSEKWTSCNVIFAGQGVFKRKRNWYESGVDIFDYSSRDPILSASSNARGNRLVISAPLVVQITITCLVHWWQLLGQGCISVKIFLYCNLHAWCNLYIQLSTLSGPFEDTECSEYHVHCLEATNPNRNRLRFTNNATSLSL